MENQGKYTRERKNGSQGLIGAKLGELKKHEYWKSSCFFLFGRILNARAILIYSRGNFPLALKKALNPIRLTPNNRYEIASPMLLVRELY